MDKDLDLVDSNASKTEEASSCPDDLLVGLNDPSPVEIGPARDASNSEKVFSCRYDDLKQIKDQLVAQIPSKLKVIAIVGMGGIGKTTLAKSIYEDPEVSYHFHCRAWATISQEYNSRNVLAGLLRSMDSLHDIASELRNDYLAELLYRRLKGRKYLIVLDDMWNAKTWYDLKCSFPNDSNGSRIILTSRLMEVAEYAESDSPPHCLNCLSNEESWRLLHYEVFIGKPCPSDLVEIGQEIAKRCQGLPLAISVVAGQLSKIDMNHDRWADVAKGLDSLVTGNEEQILDILCLSYNHLPQHLKACFLYMGIFPKNSEIHVGKLIRLWPAVGFLRSEDEAEKCLEDLINRNLIMVREKKVDGTVRTCGIHDLLWDLCLRQATKEGHYVFGQSYYGQSCSTPRDDKEYLMGLASSYLHFAGSRGLIVDCFKLLKVLDLRAQASDHFPDEVTRTGSLRYLETLINKHSWARAIFPNLEFAGSDRFLHFDWFKALKVLDIHSLSFYHFPHEVTQIVSLRYLELATASNIPGSISKLCNLETLINNHSWAGPILPKEIWLLQRLRHLHVGFCTFLPNPSDATSNGSAVPILPHLKTLSTLSFASCTEQVFSSIPNLQQLKILEMGEDDERLFDYLNNLSCLHRLQNLSVYFCQGMRRQPQKQNLCRDTFPPSVKKLTLKESHLPWENMNILAMLPNLEVLKLKDNAFKGSVYEQTLEGFPRLKVLIFENLDLEHWMDDGDTTHFPVLQRLIMKFCVSLKEIPYCIGEISTLEFIELCGCSSSANESAGTIQKEQQSMGNYDLRVRFFKEDSSFAKFFKDDRDHLKIRMRDKLHFKEQGMRDEPLAANSRLAGAIDEGLPPEDEQGYKEYFEEYINTLQRNLTTLDL